MGLNNTIICQKCEALLIDEEFESHKCTHNYKFEGDYLLIRIDGRWKKLYLPVILGYQPIGNTDKSTDNETAPVLGFCQLNSTSLDFFSL